MKLGGRGLVLFFVNMKTLKPPEKLKKFKV